MGWWLPVVRKYLDRFVVVVGFAGVSAGAWTGWGTAVGLLVGGGLTTVFGLLFVDMDDRDGGTGGESAT